MKKQLITVIALAGITAGATMAFAAAGSKGGGIVGSAHDMNTFITSYGGTKDIETRVCAYCHTPHHAANTTASTTVTVTNPTTGLGVDYEVITYLPLWSRSVPAGGYQEYVTATFDPAADGKFYDPMAGPSRLCMSCHDGSVAVDSYYGKTGTATRKGDDDLNYFSGSSHFAVGDKAGTGLSNDHPVGFVYNEMQANTNYELKASSEGFLGNTTKTIDSVLTNIQGVGKVMSCASCHDVHNGPAVGNTAPTAPARGYFLLASQVNSALCLSCHDKDR